MAALDFSTVGPYVNLTGTKFQIQLVIDILDKLSPGFRDRNKTNITFSVCDKCSPNGCLVGFRLGIAEYSDIKKLVESLTNEELPDLKDYVPTRGKSPEDVKEYKTVTSSFVKRRKRR